MPLYQRTVRKRRKENQQAKNLRNQILGWLEHFDKISMLETDQGIPLPKGGQSILKHKQGC